MKNKSELNKKCEVILQEIAAERANFPDPTAWRQYLDKKHQDRIDKAYSDAKPLVNELKKLGFEIEHPADLDKMNYRVAIPTLLDWLPRICNRHIQDCIIRALSVKYAFPLAWKPLMHFFETMEGILQGNRWVIGDTLYELANDSVYDDIAKLAINESYGTDRAMIIRALGKMKKHPEVIDVLLSILEKGEAELPALEALGKLKAVKARSQVEKFMFHQDADIRQEAKRALAKIDHVIEKNEPGYVKKPAIKKKPYVPMKKRVWQKLDPNAIPEDISEDQAG